MIVSFHYYKIRIIKIMVNYQNIGYRRVSSSGQNLDRQLDGIKLDEIFEEKISGKTKKRPALDDCIKHCRKGDTLYIHSMDRLARNLKDLLDLVETFTSNGVAIRFTKENLVFAGSDNPMSKVMLQIMGAIAEFERSLILDRQKEGIKKALEKGVQFGRKKSVDDEKMIQIIELLRAGKNKSEVCKKVGISRSTLYRELKSRNIEVETIITAPGLPVETQLSLPIQEKKVVE
jgi:DNA invertase Pin-like site-specific DNA recombinase